MKKYYAKIVRNGLMVLILGIVFLGVQKYRKPYSDNVSGKSASFRSINTLYGTFDVTEPVLIELFDSPAMERIKKVHQFGVYYFIKNGKPKKYTRYTHSVGVWALLKKYGASIEEQIAGLLHDASHTVFSHVGDYLFKEGQKNKKNSYQDDIHTWYLQQQKVDQILAKHGYSLEQISHKNGKHCALEQSLPDLCADRLEYNLYEGVIEEMINERDVQDILASLEYNDGKWFFTSPDLARKFAEIPLHLTANHWGSPGNFLLYSWAAAALKRAINLQLLSWDDIHFSTDEVVWQKLVKSDDSIIVSCLQKMNGYKDLFVLSDAKTCNYLVKAKFRGIDPLVRQGDSYKRLTQIDADFNKKYHNVYGQLTHGWPIKLLGIAAQDSDSIPLVIT